jgi:hypothetical protein
MGLQCFQKYRNQAETRFLQITVFLGVFQRHWHLEKVPVPA